MENVQSFLATVSKVFLKSEDFLDLKTDKDFVSFYNDNKKFDKKDARFLGAIEFSKASPIIKQNYAFPFDKNNITYPIIGETVLIIVNGTECFWLPYTNTQYPNYRQDYKTSMASKERNIAPAGGGTNSKDYKESKDTGTPNQTKPKSESEKKKYKVNEKVKFLKPKEGDTILQGRVGNTIRFSELFLTEDDKTSSPSIFIRNKQNPKLDEKPIGELIEEDINEDGTSIYLTSGKVKVPFKETIKKTKDAFKDYPASDKLTGDQLWVNSDRIILSAKAKEFIIFGKGNTGIITDGTFTVDAEKDVYLHTNKNITLHSKGNNKIFLNSDSGGKIYLGKDKGEGDAGAAVQKMVLGGELVKIMEELIDAITKQVYLTPAGPSSPGPTNAAAFNAIKGKLKTILSAKNFLSKS
jgi:hypothetical protein